MLIKVLSWLGLFILNRLALTCGRWTWQGVLSIIIHKIGASRHFRKQLDLLSFTILMPFETSWCTCRLCNILIEACSAPCATWIYCCRICLFVSRCNWCTGWSDLKTVLSYRKNSTLLLLCLLWWALLNFNVLNRRRCVNHLRARTHWIWLL